MSKQKPMSSRQRRVSAYWMANRYSVLMAKPQRGVITFGGGLNISNWIESAEAEGFFCVLTPDGVVLR